MQQEESEIMTLGEPGNDKLHKLITESNLKIDCLMRGCVKRGRVFERTPGFKDHLGVEIYWDHIAFCPNSHLK